MFLALGMEYTSWPGLWGAEVADAGQVASGVSLHEQGALVGEVQRELPPG
jgi:hypothetical protein